MWSLEELIRKKQAILPKLKEKYANVSFPFREENKKRFSSSLRMHYPSAIIAEVKVASPTKGILYTNDPVLLARSYIEAGAAAISVVTEPHYFNGDIKLLRKISKISPIPILRKDFIIDFIELIESKVNGADAVLLITSLLGKERLREFISLSNELGLEAVVEIHEASELDIALSAGAKIIGINNRDLRDMTVNIHATEYIAPKVLDNVLLISESGISSQEDILKLNTYGVYAFLIGTSLVQSPDPKEKLMSLKSPLKRMLEQDGPFIKFCGITNLEDALEAISAGADLLGFVLCEGKRRVPLEDLKNILKELPKEIPKIGVVTLKELSQWSLYAKEGIFAFQVHGCPSKELSTIKRPFCIPSIPCNGSSAPSSKMDLGEFL